ncbi:hypothetical protein HBP99_16325 [Listeria booriae]|uniref:hypothetical protein n=1 Tax=Listeria booriae TaxID=1552123 RepID=UPI0016240A2A|nr:hypothetical protein [Listeria booriae]MBC2370198.1 hypothetical protein [Listeria booriae]
MKKIVLVCGMAILVLLTACSNVNEGEVNNSKSSSQLETRIVDGVSLEVKQQPTRPIIENNGKQSNTLLTFAVKGTNLTPFPKGLGATDFTWKTEEGKELLIAENMTAFGDEILSGKSLSEDVYFKVPNNKIDGTLQYKVNNKVISEWKIGK